MSFLIFLLWLPTAIMSCLQVSMDKITALITFREKFLANRLIMKYSSVIPLLTFDLILSFISGLFSLYSSYTSFSCSSTRFLAHLSFSLRESSQPRVFSLVSPMQSSLFLNSGCVLFDYSFLHQIHYPLLVFYLGFLFCEYFFLPVIKVSEVFFLLFFPGIRCLSGVTLHTLPPCLVIP